jgi:hypothetical protein
VREPACSGADVLDRQSVLVEMGAGMCMLQSFIGIWAAAMHWSVLQHRVGAELGEPQSCKPMVTQLQPLGRTLCACKPLE